MIVALAFVAAVPECAFAQEEPLPQGYDRQMIGDLYEQYLQAKGYQAAFYEEDLSLPFRAYMSGYSWRRDPRGMLTSSPQGRISDKLTLDGRVQVEQTFDSNLFLSTSNPTSDAITVFSPVLQGRFEDSQTQARINYLGRDRLFADNSYLNGMEHFLEGRFRYLGNRFAVETWDNFAYQKDPIDTLLFSGRITTRQNDLGGNIHYSFAKLFLELKGLFRRYDALSPLFDYHDYSHVEAAGAAAMDVVVRMQATMEIGGSSVTFDEGVLDDFDTRWWLVGLRGRPSEKLAFSLQTGFVQVNVIEGSGTRDRNDETELAARATVFWRIGAKDMLAVFLSRWPSESVITGWTLRTGLTATYSHWLAERITGDFTTGWEMLSEEASEGNRYEYLARAAIRYEMGDNFFATASTEVREGYSGGSYQDFRGSLGVGVEW